MRKDDELTIELAKNKADEIIARQELDNAKDRFIEEINNGLGEEIRNCDISSITVPIKIHKPLKLRITEFFNRLSKVI